MPAPVRVEILASDTVWISAAADGQPRFQVTLQPQQSRLVTAQSAVRLRVGDAGALTLTLNGERQPPLGPKGQVRTVLLTPQGMQVLAPPPRPAPGEGESTAPAEGETGPGKPPAVEPPEQPKPPAF
ncbi:MAG: DUF4115 domain-containing protein [Acidobacteria bacterium]|nr:DUF4115 domain-containing protein [Acidobacteriota bacterium]